MKPGPQHGAIADRAGLPDQDEEGGLEGVLRIVRVGEDPPADPEHHRPVAAEDGLEGFLVPLREEPVEELAFAGSRHGPFREQALQ